MARTPASVSPSSLTPIGPTGSHTAVLFFSHRPEREWQNKRFVRQDFAKHRAVATAFYRHAREAVGESGLPVLEATDAHQRGSTFGARLTNAVTDAFAEGYEQLIVVGSDCPRLHEVDWSSVAEELSSGTPVLGPTPDGSGAYLIGLRRDHFDPGSFESLPWTSAGLLSALTGHLHEASGTAPRFLAARDDVNDHGELVALLRSSAPVPTRLAAQLRRVLGGGGRVVSTDEATSHRRTSSRRSRAPPASAVPSFHK